MPETVPAKTTLNGKIEWRPAVRILAITWSTQAPKSCAARANVRLPWTERLQILLRQNPDEFYISGIELLTLLITVAIIWRGIDIYSLGSIFFAAVVLLLPCSQSAVEVMNYLVTSILQPRMLPKLDFQQGIPEECTTMVVVPSLLLSEKQVRQLVRDLEVRYVGNLSPNLHFAVLTDLPDSAEQLAGERSAGGVVRPAHPRAEPEVRRQRSGNIFHVSPAPRLQPARRRVDGLGAQARQAAGPQPAAARRLRRLSRTRSASSRSLPRIRYMLTLDSTPSCRAGPRKSWSEPSRIPSARPSSTPSCNIVVEGFGILQPRVGVSVQSAARSRLAAIFSGQTGFDLYTRAVSDVYQDLYGEGSFTGKGIYEVARCISVLDHRFPRNSLLSHDLIEGAYTRAGLVSDVELIDEYPVALQRLHPA